MSCGGEEQGNGSVGQPGNGNQGGGNSGGSGQSGNVVVSGLSLQYRHGQTFITWNEPRGDAGYHIYRSPQPITNDTLNAATLLTSRWGALGSDTTVNKHAASDVPGYFVIDRLGAPLSDSAGLFVNSVQSTGTAYYAVTAVVNGSENKTIVPGVNTASIQESVATPQPVLTRSVNGGKGRLYTHYMDYQRWNPTFNGYAFNYFVALPYNYDSSRSYPLQLMLHAFGDSPGMPQQVPFEWQLIQLLPIDPGEAEGAWHTWWYGHARDHNYKRSGAVPTSGAVENFTEQRVMKAIQETLDNSEFTIDENLLHAYGNSMGASGAVSLALRYPSILSGVYASQPMMNYRTSPLFQDNFLRLFGSVSSNLPTVNGGLLAQSIERYGLGGDRQTGVWDWMDHHAQVRRRSGDEFAFIMLDFGKADSVIDWQTQGHPTYAAFTDARLAYTSIANAGIGHTWLGFGSANGNLYPLESGRWIYPRNLSFPGLHNASGSGRVNPPVSGDDFYQTDLEWSTPQFSFGQPITDQSNRYEVTLRSVSVAQSVDVTPRKTRSFRPSAGTACSWLARRVSDNQITGSGSVNAGASRLVTIPQVPVAIGSGTRLSINCP